MANFASYQGGVNDEPSFQRLAKSVGSNIQKISQNVTSMTKMVNQLQTSQDSLDLRNQLRQIQNYTQKMVKDTHTMVTELMKIPTHDNPGNQLTRDRLSDEYMTTLNAFQTAQKTAAQKTKADVKKVKAQNFQIGDPFASSNSQLIDVNNTALQKQEQVTMQTERELQELEQREQDVRQLESDILDVNQIFKELGTLIHDQGSVVDSIESNVEMSAHTVEAGTQELRTAATYKNSLRKKKVYLTIIGIIIASIILIIIFHN